MLLSSARVQRGAISAGSPGLPLGCAAPGGTGVGFGSWAHLILGLIGLQRTVVPMKGVVLSLQRLAQGLEKVILLTAASEIEISWQGLLVTGQGIPVSLTVKNP